MLSRPEQLDIYTATRVKTNELTIYLADVPSEHLESIDGLVKKALKRIGEEGIDMERMGMVIRREKRQVSLAPSCVTGLAKADLC